MSADLNQYLCFNFYRGWREISSIYKEILGNDVSPQHFYILQLCDLKEKATMNELSKGLHLDGSAVSTLVSRMEKKQLIKRTHGTKDRRNVFVQLTEKGDALKTSLEPKISLLASTISKNISAEEITKVQEVVSIISDNRASL